MIEEFKRVRRKDVLVCTRVSDCEWDVTFHELGVIRQKKIFTE
jgi:hypothetical protein